MKFIEVHVMKIDCDCVGHRQGKGDVLWHVVCRPVVLFKYFLECVKSFLVFQRY